MYHNYTLNHCHHDQSDDPALIKLNTRGIRLLADDFGNGNLPMIPTYSEQFSRQMGMTRKEFMRTLPAAIAPLSHRLEQETLVIEHPGGEIRIGLQAAPDRRIAALGLPVLRVDFQFSRLSTEQRARFMERFDLSFHRGGG